MLRTHAEPSLERWMLVTLERKFLSFALIGLLNISLSAVLSIAPAKASVDGHRAPTDPQAITVCEERISGIPYQVTRVLIKARPAEVWQVLTDYAGAPNVFPTLKKCQVLSDKGTTKVVRYVVKPTGLPTCFQYDLEVTEHPNRSMEWHRVAGDFKSVDGFWKLESAECGRSTIVTHANYVNGGFLMPQSLIKHQSHVDLPQVMASLKDRAERTMQIASHGGHQLN